MKQSRLLPLIFAGLIGLAACATNQSSRGTTPLPHGFREYSINELMSNQLRNDLPLRIQIPGEYLPHKPPLALGTLWSVEEDWRQLSKGKEATRKHGFLIAQISMNLGYDQARNLFFGNTGDENSMVTDMIRQGWMDVKLRRYNVNGYPILIVEAGQHGDLRARMMYIGLKAANNALFIHYHGREPWSDLDTHTWETIKASVLGSKPK